MPADQSEGTPRPGGAQTTVYECVVSPGAMGAARWRAEPHPRRHRDGCYKTLACGCTLRYNSTFYHPPKEAGWRRQFWCPEHFAAIEGKVRL